MKAHIGVDADSGLMHTVVGTAANVNDVTQAGALVHGEETDVFADAGYEGVAKREHLKASIWAKVEHPFRVIKRQFGHVKVRYRGLMKNTAQLHRLFPLSNLWMARHRLLQSVQG